MKITHLKNAIRCSTWKRLSSEADKRFNELYDISQNLPISGRDIFTDHLERYHEIAIYCYERSRAYRD